MNKIRYEKERAGVRIRQGNFFAPQDVKNKYRYNGKEFIEDFNIGLYDYGARWYACPELALGIRVLVGF